MAGIYLALLFRTCSVIFTCASMGLMQGASGLNETAVTEQTLPSSTFSGVLGGNSTTRQPRQSNTPCYLCQNGPRPGLGLQGIFGLSLNFGFGAASDACFSGWQACDGVRQCRSGRDELGCGICPQCAYSQLAATAVTSYTGYTTFYTGISLEGCARVCTDLEPGCSAFTYSQSGRTCSLYSQVNGRTIRLGVDLYTRFGLAAPPLIQTSTAPLILTNQQLLPSCGSSNPPPNPCLASTYSIVPQPTLTNAFPSLTTVLNRSPVFTTVTATPQCSSDLSSHFPCSADQCLSAWRVCDGQRQCRVGSEEHLCGSYLQAFSPPSRRSLGNSRRLDQRQVRSTEACAAACVWRWGSRQDNSPCTAFSFTAGICQLGCTDCAEESTGRWLDGTVQYWLLSPVQGVKALFPILQNDQRDFRLQTLHALFRLGSIIPGNGALGDQKLNLAINGQPNMFDSRTMQLLRPISPPITGPSLTNLSPSDARTVIGYSVTSRPSAITERPPSNGPARPISLTTLQPTVIPARPTIRPTQTVVQTIFLASTREPFVSTTPTRKPPKPATNSMKKPRPRPTTSQPRGPARRPEETSTRPSRDRRPSTSRSRQEGETSADENISQICGRRPVEDGSAQPQYALRVVGGDRVQENGLYPWQAQLKAFNATSGEFQARCGAILVGRRHVLTAAHCVVDAGLPLRIVVGQSDRSLAFEPDRQTINVVNFLTHPGYRSVSKRPLDDIAVLGLRTSVRFTDYVQPLCLPRDGTAGKPGQKCLISGWGRRKFSRKGTPLEKRLHGAWVPVVSDAFCASREVYNRAFLPEKMVCAGDVAGGADSCQGDSGGPLACTDSEGRWTAVGIISFGEGCGRAVKPGVYTEVKHYMGWVLSVLPIL